MIAPSANRENATNWGPVLSLAANLGLLLLLCLPWIQNGNKMSGLDLATRAIHQVLNKSPEHGDIGLMIALGCIAFLALPAIGAILGFVAILNGRDRDARYFLGRTIAVLAVGMLILRAYFFKDTLIVMLPPFWFSFACDVVVVVGGLQENRRRSANQQRSATQPASPLLSPKALVTSPLQSQAISPGLNMNGGNVMINAPDSLLANTLRTLGVLLILVGGGVAWFVINQATGPGLFSSSRSVEPGDVLAAGTVFFVFLVVGLTAYGVGEVLQQALNIFQFLDHQANVTTQKPSSPNPVAADHDCEI